MRAYWRGDTGKMSEAGFRLTGSADLYQDDGRSPSSSINLVTAHDGFTLRDLVSYNGKHNEANGEDNRDGSDNDQSWNCGAEGPTDDPEVNRLRWRQMRNFLGTLLLSQGTPMIVGGDELGRTQRGNNNAYCQDNEISWFDWNLSDDQRALIEFTRKVIKLRAEHPTFRRAGFFRGRPIRGLGVDDIVWLRHDGQPMADEDWQNPITSSFAMYLAGAGVDRTDEQGNPEHDDDFLLAMNASSADLELVLPQLGNRADSHAWELVLDTFDDNARETRQTGDTSALRARSFKVYRRPSASQRTGANVEGTPSATYRLQLIKDFTFDAATSIIDYLAKLGISAVYTSPYTQAERGSTHGYNVVDHCTINPELGGTSGHEKLVAALREHKLGHVLDFVPNHVGIGSGENRWWLDVLENGPGSLYADYFDIDWHPPTLGLENRVLLPVLGRQYGAELEDGKLAIVRDDGQFFVAYYDRRLPVAPRTYRMILEPAVERLELAKGDHHLQELQSIISAVTHMPDATETGNDKREERAREKEVIKRRLAELCQGSPEIAKAIDEVLAAGDIDWLDTLLNNQNYRLAYWRVATEEINYRRFFDINELAAIRMEDPRVFEAAHSLVFELVRNKAVTGLRLDHTDGLYEPVAYFRQLRQRLGNIYMVAEKILEPGESLPRNWPIAGTTGYDFIAAICGVWVDPRAEDKLTDLYCRLTETPRDFASMVFDGKRQILETSLSSEIIMLGQELRRIAEADRRSRDFTLTALTTAIADTIAAFPVYRTYIRPDGSREPNDEAHIDHAVRLAYRKNRGLDPSVLNYLRDVLLLNVTSPRAIHFAMRFQQLTGPVMAKGVEDTAMYRYHRLISNNEVGCDPATFAHPIEELHAHNAATLGAFPLTMTATTTHDTKRSEDVRTRIAVLSELPDEWEARITRWLERAHGYDAVPSPNDLYLLFQTLVGAWPFAGEDPTLRERVTAYMTKAIREAKIETSWTRPDARYEAAVTSVVAHIFEDRELLASIAELAGRVAPFGACNSLAQTAIKLASPGVADTYQGTELWDLSLVDPDNRRPVDYGRRRQLLDELMARGAPTPELARELVSSYADGRIKLHLTRIGLQMRRTDPQLFLDGTYAPLDGGKHVIAFERARSNQRLVCVVPRLPYTLTDGRLTWPLGSDAWGDTTIELDGDEGTTWRNAFTGEQHTGSALKLASVLATFPVAWLVTS
jgi:(1->4)-alpha-D-glucan 1-alpha-D-glucosylmutase